MATVVDTRPYTRTRRRLGRSVLYYPTAADVAANGAGPYRGTIVVVNADGTCTIALNLPGGAGSPGTAVATAAADVAAVATANAAVTAVADAVGDVGSGALANDLKAKWNAAVALVNEEKTVQNTDRTLVNDLKAKYNAAVTVMNNLAVLQGITLKTNVREGGNEGQFSIFGNA